ncbi:MAG TPA: MASE1 domain-containing protein [Solirubrobacteraceae bacterium]
MEAASRRAPGRIWASRALADLHGGYLLRLLALVAAYYAAAHVGYTFEFAGPVAAIVWLPVGVGIAFLYLAGLQYWPGVLIGDLLVNNYSALPVGSAIGQSCGNLLEVLVAAALMRHFAARVSPLGSVGDLGRMLFALAAGTAVSATVGTISLTFGGVVSAGAAPEVWRTWWLGDASGALVVVPLVVAWSEQRPTAWWRGRPLEAALMLLAVAGLSEIASRTTEPFRYVAFPALIWAALRFGRRGATLAIAVAAGVTVWNTTHYGGPFVFHSITNSVLTTQLFIAVAALSTLSLAAVVSERERFAAGLGASRVRLVEAADVERRRLEHNLHDGAQQRLTALAFSLDRIAECARDGPGEVSPLIDAARSDLSTAIDELRELAHGIHPAVLTDLGLASAIRTLADRSVVPVELLELPSARVDEIAEAAAYYVVAEAVTNAQKHAKASMIRVRAETETEPGRLRIEVVDDGGGGASESAGSGLGGLRDRIEAVGGTFELDSALGWGTRIVAVIPTTRD